MTTTTKQAPAYTTTGSVRGDCGHRHRTDTGALACLQRDRAGCRRQGGYSDRRIVALGGAPEVDVVDGYLAASEEMAYCGGCGCDVVSAAAAYHGGVPYCDVCEAAPAED